MRATRAFLAILVLTLGAPAQARRIALVIGNDVYQNVPTLRNARSDAKAIAATLRTLGFDVTLKQDLALSPLKAALREFKARIGRDDEVVFYFSGHGVQFEGTNYLVPTDIVADNQQQVADDAVPLQRVMDDMSDQHARFALAIVDACRDNPFKSVGRAIGGRGLAPMAAANGQMVLYSAGAGQSALDSLGPRDPNPNGVFTRVLIKEMTQPGVTANDMIRTVRQQVVQLAKSVGHDQVPAIYDQTEGDFYFRPGPPPNAAASGAPPLHVQTPGELDQSFWDRIKDSGDPADFNDYQRQFPKGIHAAEAALMARKLSRAGNAAHSAAAPAPAPAATTGPPSPFASGGPYPGFLTSTLNPGFRYKGTLVVRKDGAFEYTGANGDRLRGIASISDTSNIVGTGISELGQAFPGVQNRYPDGSTSTQVTMRGRVVNRSYDGDYADKFQTGQFHFDLGHVN